VTDNVKKALDPGKKWLQWVPSLFRVVEVSHHSLAVVVVPEVLRLYRNADRLWPEGAHTAAAMMAYARVDEAIAPGCSQPGAEGLTRRRSPMRRRELLLRLIVAGAERAAW
jgi:hypothetical protein